MEGKGKLDGRIAVVTGAAGGIGAAYALRLAELGGTVIVADVDGDGADRMAKELVAAGHSAESGQIDISDADQVEVFVDETVERHGVIDVLVNNAAMYRGLEFARAEDIDLQTWRRMMDVNINGTFYMCRAAIPHMRRRKYGRIVNQTSAAAYSCSPNTLHYTLSKAAVIPMTKVLAREVGEDNITVNAIAPGLIGTEATLEALPEEARSMAIGAMSVHRMGEPQDLLGALEFLCTDASNYVTGQTFVVDGGMFMLG